MVLKIRLRLKNSSFFVTLNWSRSGPITIEVTDENRKPVIPPKIPLQWLGRMQTYVLNPTSIAEPVQVSEAGLGWDGTNLAAVLDDLKDNHEERWKSLLAEMQSWLPEYESIQFDRPQPGQKGIVLRTKKGGHRIPAKHLSQGTLVALALLTLRIYQTRPR